MRAKRANCLLSEPRTATLACTIASQTDTFETENGSIMRTAKRLAQFAAMIAVLLAATLPTLAADQASTTSADKRAVRRVNGQLLTSTEMPAIRLKFSEEFKYVGHQSLVLYGIAHAEQHFFVDADEQGRIKRLYWIQFEGYLPTNSHSYQYKITNQVRLGGFTFISDAFVGSSVNAEKNRPESDLGRAEAFLEDKGYKINRNDFILQRLVHLIGEARRNELMIIYAEDLESQRMAVPKIPEGGNATDQWITLTQGLLKRAAENMMVSQ